MYPIKKQIPQYLETKYDNDDISYILELNWIELNLNWHDIYIHMHIVMLNEGRIFIKAYMRWYSFVFDTQKSNYTQHTIYIYIHTLHQKAQWNVPQPRKYTLSLHAFQYPLLLTWINFNPNMDK